MRMLDTSRDDPQTIRAALAHKLWAPASPELEGAVREIIARVRADGDAAVLALTRQLDSPTMDGGRLEVTRAELQEARRRADPVVLAALEEAALSIQAFHRREAGQLQSWIHVDPSGRLVGQTLRPVQRAAVYVPGGLAAYPSTVLMCAIPAAVAGVEEIYVCTPPGPDGEIPELVAAACAGWADRVFRVGGAQAIAALAHGTETIPPVDVIVGPGNRYVTEAKRQVFGIVGIDMLAGPSEVCIIADEGANPRFIAADLLAQIEHGPDNRGVVLTDSADIAARVGAEVERMAAELRRRDVLAVTLQNAVSVTTETIADAVALANGMAPEHLELHVRDPLAVLPLVRNAGAVLLGDYTGAALGDYVAGPSHTLPTAGAARFSSSLSAATFMRRSSIISYPPGAARVSGAIAARLAEGEGFDAHALSAQARMEGPAP